MAADLQQLAAIEINPSLALTGETRVIDVVV
jgi:hypothetical protein